jgi:hypothetical protein
MYPGTETWLEPRLGDCCGATAAHGFFEPKYKTDQIEILLLENGGNPRWTKIDVFFRQKINHAHH